MFRVTIIINISLFFIFLIHILSSKKPEGSHGKASTSRSTVDKSTDKLSDNSFSQTINGVATMAPKNNNKQNTVVYERN